MVLVYNFSLTMKEQFSTSLVLRRLRSQREFIWEAIINDDAVGLKTSFNPDKDAFLADRGFTRCRSPDDENSSEKQEILSVLSSIQRQ